MCIHLVIGFHNFLKNRVITFKQSQIICKSKTVRNTCNPNLIINNYTTRLHNSHEYTTMRQVLLKSSMYQKDV